jgi:hypothetical protein
MAFLRNSLAGLALILAITLSVIIGVAIASFLPRVTREGGGGEVSISGIGNNLNGGYNSSSVGRLARRAAESQAVAQVSDETLRDVAAALTAKARDGDVNAAAIVFELADAQKKLRTETAAKNAATRTGEGR